MLYFIMLLVLLCKSSKSTTLDCSRTRSCPRNEFHCDCQAFAVLRWFVRLPDGTSCMKEYPSDAVGIRGPLGQCQASVILTSQTNNYFTSSLDIFNLTNQTTVSCQGSGGTKTLTLNTTSKCQLLYP